MLVSAPRVFFSPATAAGGGAFGANFMAEKRTFEGKTASVKATELNRVRKNFPESWIWIEILTKK